MKQPCSNCPFRSDRIFGLEEIRRKHIVECLSNDHDFPCHKTTKFMATDPRFADEEGETWSDEASTEIYLKAKRCTGAAIFLEKILGTGLRANLMFRMALMRGEFTLEELDMDSPVFDTAEEFINAK